MIFSLDQVILSQTNWMFHLTELYNSRSNAHQPHYHILIPDMKANHCLVFKEHPGEFVFLKKNAPKVNIFKTRTIMGCKDLQSGAECLLRPI